MLNNKYLLEHEEEDALTLFSGMFPTQLPPILNEVFSEKSVSKLVTEISNNPKDQLFYRKRDSKLINYLAKDGVKSPKKIFGKSLATESIKFFTIKVDNSWRPLAIPNIKYSLMFTYNSIIMSDNGLTELYKRDNRITGTTSHSESPMIGRDGFFSTMLYEDVDDPVGFIGYDGQNKFFKDSKLQRFRMESVYPYILEIDLSKYFENIYTHLIEKISLESLGLDDTNNIFKEYLKWLSEYNQKINDNHTKGIVQGPVSSKITAELLQLSLDMYINNIITDLKVDIKFIRYVDDYRFYGKYSTDLELFKNSLIKLFRKYELSFNEKKIKLYKGFEVQKQSNITKYSEIRNLLFSRKKTKFSFDLYLNLRESMIVMIDNDDFPTLKASLTLIKKRILNSTLILTDNEIVVSFIHFLIKISYVIPIVATHVYKIINAITDSMPKMKSRIWNILKPEMKYIDENFSDTDLQIWYYYVLTCNGNSKETYQIAKSYLDKNKPSNYNVLVLTVLLKQRSKKANDRIKKDIMGLIEDYDIEEISQSKWWLPISKIWVVYDGHVEDKKIKELFITQKNSNLQWNRLGIIEFLRKNSK